MSLLSKGEGRRFSKILSAESIKEGCRINCFRYCDNTLVESCFIGLVLCLILLRNI